MYKPGKPGETAAEMFDRMREMAESEPDETATEQQTPPPDAPGSGVEQRQLELVQSVAIESQEAEAEAERRQLGYCCRILVQTTLPHSRPIPGVTEYVRRNGKLTLMVKASSEYGLPYGRYPRQLLGILCGEAVRTRSPEIDIDVSLRAFVENKLRRKYSAGKRGTATAIKDQLIRLSLADIQAEWREEGKCAFRRLSPITKTVVFWDPEDHRQIVDWQAQLTLSHEFFQELIAHPIPVNLDTLASFQSAMKMDIYTWLTYRFSYLSARTVVPWEGLQGQFGCGYPTTKRGMRNFRVEFCRDLKGVLEKYPQARVVPTSEGVQLDPSPPHVLRLLGGKR
jgi:hypothetical protein